MSRMELFEGCPGGVGRWAACGGLARAGCEGQWEIGDGPEHIELPCSAGVAGE